MSNEPLPTPTPEPSSNPTPDTGKSFLNTDPTAPPAPKDGEPALKDPPKDGEPPKDPKETPAGAPEKYEEFKLPDGYKLDAEVNTTVQALFKEMNLSQDQAQKLVDFYAKSGLEASTAPYKAWADLQKSWSTEITDRFGTKAETMRTDINGAITAALPPKLANAFRTALDLTGAGTNPDIVEALSIFTAPFVEGKPVVPGRPSPKGQESPGGQQVTMADAIYSHLRKSS